MKYLKRWFILIFAISLTTIVTGFQQSESIAITSPVAGETIRGIVAIKGTAAGSNFQYYKIEIAEGDAPVDNAWHLLNSQIYDQPVTADFLENWDTNQFPDGSYSLRLRVVDNTGNYAEMIVSSITIQNVIPTSTAPSDAPQSEEPTQAVAQVDTTALPGMWTIETVAQELETFNEVIGAIYDPENGQLLFIGRFNSDLPAEATLKLDDLVTAFQVIYNGEFPAVSIDPSDNINSLDVRYFGSTEGTGLGWTMFEADRLLKVYSMGLDNITNQPVASNVPGYKNVLDLASPNSGSFDVGVWSRMWFEAEDAEDVAVKQSNNKQAILFDQAHMVVKTEYISIDGSPKPGGSDPADEAFVKHFNENFDTFAQERPIFHRLNQIQRFLITARWLRDQGIPLDKLWISEYESKSVETPLTTPSRMVSGEVSPYVRLVISGGVDFFPENNYSSNNKDANALANVVADVPPINGKRQGEITFNDNVYKIATFPTQQQSYYVNVDKAGNTIYIDIESGNPRTYIATDGTVTNFDEFDEFDRPIAVTTQQSQNRRTFIYGNGTLDTIRYENELDQETLEATFLVDLKNLLAREVNNVTSSDQEFNLFAQTGFSPINWSTLEDSNGNKERVWSVTLQGQPRVIKEIDSDIQLTSTDSGQEIYLNDRRFIVLEGKAAVHLNNRILNFRHSTDETKFVYFYSNNGSVAIQYGQQPEIVISDISFSELESLDDPDLSKDEFDEIMAKLDGIFTGENNEVLFSGQFPDSSEWTEFKQKAQQLSKNLGIALRVKGLVEVWNDDDPTLALENLAAQQPIGDTKPFNLAAVFYDETFSSSQQIIAEQLKNIFTENGIPVHNSLAEVQDSTTNVIIITAHSTAELEQHIRTLGEAGVIEGKSLILNVCGQAGNRDFLTDLVQKFGATVVASADGNLEIEGLLDIIPKFLESKDGLITPNWFQAIDDVLKDSELPEENKHRIRPYQRGINNISQIPKEFLFELPA